MIAQVDLRKMMARMLAEMGLCSVPVIDPWRATLDIWKRP